MNNTVKARLERLEAAIKPDEGPEVIFIVSPSPGYGLPDYTDDDVIGCESDEIVLERRPGESVQELKERAAAVRRESPRISLWIMHYRETAAHQ